MEKVVDVNKFLFGKTEARKKLEVINTLNDLAICRATNTTILRIVRGCKGNDGRFYIRGDRKKGNDLDSTIEFVEIDKNNASLCLSVKDGCNEGTIEVHYNVFNGILGYEGYCESLQKHFSYSPHNVASVLRSILVEYIYCKYIDKGD